VILSVLLILLTWINSFANGTFTFTITIQDGSTITYVGTITDWDDKGPHGNASITVRDRYGNEISWNVTFRDDVIDFNPHHLEFPEAIEELSAYISTLEK